MNPSPPKNPTPKRFWNAMPRLTPLAAHRNESFCAISSPPIVRQVHRDDLPRVGRRERQLLLPLPLVHERGHEERLAGQQPLARADQGVEEAARLLRAVAEDRLHPDAVFHVHEAARFRERGLARIELDLDVLHVVAEDLVVHFVHLCHGRDLLPARVGRAAGWYAARATFSCKCFGGGRSRRRRCRVPDGDSTSSTCAVTST